MSKLKGGFTLPGEAGYEELYIKNGREMGSRCNQRQRWNGAFP